MKNPQTISDEALMDDVVNGDPSALKALYERHRRILYSAALRITSDPGSAEEILQDTFFQLWQKSSQFDSARGSLIGWLLTITRRRAISRARKQSDRFGHHYLCNGTIESSQNIGSTTLERLIAQELVSAALEGLPKAQLDAVTLAYFEGWTTEQIASHTKMPVGTIKTRLRSGLKTMKRVLSNPSPVLLERARRSVTLERVLITEQLASRGCKQRRSQEETESLNILAQAVAASPEELIDAFLRMPIALCGAGTAGLSLLETNSKGAQVFRWTNLAGKLAKYAGGETPRNFSPCGVTLDRNSPQLFAYPGRYFHYFNDVDIPIVEGLVIPFHVGARTKGTVWIVSHEEGLRFDSEDVRIMTTLTEFASCALHLGRSLPARE